jgi:hypothetical protein
MQPGFEKFLMVFEGDFEDFAGSASLGEPIDLTRIQDPKELHHGGPRKH